MSYKLIINDKNLDKVVEACDLIAATLSNSIFEKWKINITEFGNVDTGEYIASLQIQKISGGYYVIFSDKEYSVFVEYGSGPAIGKESYIPPFQPIRDWVERKLGYSGKEADAVAWYIIKKIEKEGIEPSPSARNALNETSYIAVTIAKEILKAIK